MTYREKLEKEYPDAINQVSAGGCIGCPGDYWKGSSAPRVNDANCRKFPLCEECWDQEAPEDAPTQAQEPQRRFETGAVRDSAAGRGRFDLLPWAAIHALAKHSQRGAEHYGERNVDKGIPQHSLIDSALRHIALYIQGDAEAHHLVAALWNIAWACEQEAKRPQLIDLPERTDESGPAL